VLHADQHRQPCQTTLNAGLRAPTHGMGSPWTEVRGLRPRCRSGEAEEDYEGAGKGEHVGVGDGADVLA
jgi:hypothetical protein